MKNRSTPTLDDVARAAGVSTATVSRCLNFPDRVVDSTRQKVLRAIDDLGYTPNFGARVMASRRTFTIGAIVPTMENAIFARGLQAFQEECHQRGYTLLVASSAYRPEVEEEQIGQLVARGADGLLLIGFDRHDRIYDFLNRRNVPAVVAWTFAENTPLPCVGFDNHASMQNLAQSVLDQGHRNVAVISAVTEGNDRARARVEGVRAALRVRGVNLEPSHVIEVPYDVQNGAAAFDRLMALEPRPTAVICGNDVLAVGAVVRARELGLTVPVDVSITGFDDIEMARIVTPALTTVRVPHSEMGRRAACELIDIVEGKSSGASVELQSAVQVRASLGPAST
ncbi:MAG: LacI family DNA-binding transcriptional regulator [Pikeienuella sp.]